MGKFASCSRIIYVSSIEQISHAIGEITNVRRIGGRKIRQISVGA